MAHNRLKVWPGIVGHGPSSLYRSVVAFSARRFSGVFLSNKIKKIKSSTAMRTELEGGNITLQRWNWYPSGNLPVRITSLWHIHPMKWKKNGCLHVKLYIVNIYVS